ncbi:hypothetical protein COLO4_02168 [Corchorus olitorius]|uniref:Uncharacterized protein n=1 Tax=Corchorus olitorius TaxID=93759 RepID=A0A1R3L1F2_9ROSI|nr:hypothetical protein COLO4_02168 [Corchorus olitorius]
MASQDVAGVTGGRSVPAITVPTWNPPCTPTAAQSEPVHKSRPTASRANPKGSARYSTCSHGDCCPPLDTRWISVNARVVTATARIGRSRSRQSSIPRKSSSSGIPCCRKARPSEYAISNEIMTGPVCPEKCVESLRTGPSAGISAVTATTVPAESPMPSRSHTAESLFALHPAARSGARSTPFIHPHTPSTTVPRTSDWRTTASPKPHGDDPPKTSDAPGTRTRRPVASAGTRLAMIRMPMATTTRTVMPSGPSASRGATDLVPGAGGTCVTFMPRTLRSVGAAIPSRESRSRTTPVTRERAEVVTAVTCEGRERVLS